MRLIVYLCCQPTGKQIETGEGGVDTQRPAECFQAVEVGTVAGERVVLQGQRSQGVVFTQGLYADHVHVPTP